MGQAKARKTEIAAIKNKNMTKEEVVYHYTKGISLFSLFTDGFIATERKRGLTNTAKSTDYVWFTEKETYPKTALPNIPAVPSTNLMTQFMQGNSRIDLNEVARHVGGIYRFAFSTKDNLNIKKWSNSLDRTSALRDPVWAAMEKVANKVGDDVNCYWYADKDVAFENVTLQKYENGWIDVLTNFNGISLTAKQEAIVKELMMMSASELKIKDLPLHHVLQ